MYQSNNNNDAKDNSQDNAGKKTALGTRAHQNQNVNQMVNMANNDRQPGD